LLRQTFIHVPGVGSRTERHLWQSGIAQWDDFIGRYERLPLPEGKKARMRPHIEESIARLERQDHRYFSAALPKKETWRAFPEFGMRTAYLDIETTGLSPRRHEVTLVGIFDGSNVKTFISGVNLGAVERELDNYSVLVTFNGARFDVPFLSGFLPHLKLDHIHIDLLYPLRRLGYRGGLKSIERQLGIERESDISMLSGFDAVRLWHDYKRGSRDALDKLVRYNSSDIVNLQTLMRFAYDRLKKETLSPCGIS
jgi:hypothetical protein